MNALPSLAPWLAPLGWLALEAMAVVLAVLAVQPFLRTAAARRSLWRAALLALVAVLAAELTGTGSQLPAQFRLAWQTTFPKPAPPIPPPIAIPLIEPPDSTPITYHPFPIPAAEAPAPLPLSPEPLPESPPAPSLHHSITPSLPPPPPPVWPAGIWLAGLVVLLMRAAWTHAGFAWLRLRHFIPAAEALRQRAQSLAARLGLRRRVRVLASERLRAPAAFGWVRPGVGVPGDFTARFAPAQQDVMLAHELAHLAARDPLWQLLADLVAAALWWHPLAWVARRQHRLAGELAADDASQALPDGPVVLAECLLALGHEAAAAPRAALGMAGFRSQLGRRVERLVALPHRDWQAPSRLRLALQTTVALLALAALALLPGCAANRSAGEAPSHIVAKWWQAKQAPVGDDARSLSKNAERGVRNAESSKDFGSTILRLFNERRQPAWSPNSPARLAELEDKIAATIAAEVARLRAEFTTVCAKLPTDLELLRKHLEKINQSLKQLIRAANTNALKSDQRHMDVMQRYREEVENILKVEELDRAIPRSATQGRVLFNGTPPAERDIPLPILGAVTTRLQEVEQARKQKIAAFEQAGAEYKRLVESASDPNVSVQERDQRKQAAEAKLRDLQKVESNIAESDRATRFLLGEQVRIRAKAVLTTRFHRVSPDGGLADVLVYVKEGLPSVSFPASTNPHVIRIQGYEYQPYITAVQTGQPIRWETDVDLNFHPTPTNPANREFNRVLVPGRPVEATFTAPEFFLRTKDDVHPWLFGYVSVLPHPFFAVTDAEGRFRFPRPLPPGKYTLAAVHRQVGESVQELDLTQPLPAGQPPEIEFILSTKPVAGYVVVVGDEVRMEVYQRGDLRTQAKVQPDGTLTLPLIGAVKAVDKNFSELRNAIRDAYESAHFRPAHVTVTLLQSSPPLAPPPLLSAPKQASDFAPSKPPTREELLERKMRLEADIKEAEKLYRPTHPKMVGLRKQLESVEEALRQLPSSPEPGASAPVGADVRRLTSPQTPNPLGIPRYSVPSQDELLPRKARVEAEIKEAEKLYPPTDLRLVALRNQLASVEESLKQASLPVPANYDISVGRQLFVDDFLVASNTLKHTWHQPVFAAELPLFALPPAAPLPDPLPFCDRVWYDTTNQLFRLRFVFRDEFVEFHSTNGVHWPLTNVRTNDRTGRPLAQGAKPRSAPIIAHTEYESLHMSLVRPSSGSRVMVGFGHDGKRFVLRTNSPAIRPPTPADGSQWSSLHPLTNGFLVVGRNLHFYFGGRVQRAGETHASPAVGLATLRRDGFASLDAGPEGGVMTTKLVTFTGRFLFVNMKTNAPDGAMRIEILHPDGRPIEVSKSDTKERSFPFSRENCIPLAADQTLMSVTWQNWTNGLSTLAGRPVRFRFHLKNASLYSFWVGPGQLGRSLGRVAGGGPHFTNDVDTIGNRSYSPFPRATNAAPALPPKARTIAVGDYLSVEVTHRQATTNLTMRMRVRVEPSGNLQLPVTKAAGFGSYSSFLVAGKTIEEARQSIRDALVAAGTENPVVTVTKVEPPLASPQTPAPLHHQPTVEKLARIRLPEVTYDGLPLAEVLKFLSSDTKRHDPDKQGISFEMRAVHEVTTFEATVPGREISVPFQPLDVTAQSVRPDTAAVNLTATVPLPRSRVRQAAINDMDRVLIHITSVLRDVSVLDALDAIVKTSEAAIGYAVETNRVVIHPRVPGREFVSPRVSTNAPGAALRAQAEKFVFPAVIYDGLPLPEVVKLLTDDARKHDPTGRGVNFLLTAAFPNTPVPPPIDTPLLDELGRPLPIGPAPVPNRPDLETALIYVAREFRGLTLAQTLDLICKSAEVKWPNGRSAGLTYAFEDYAIVIRSRFGEPLPAPSAASLEAAKALRMRLDQMVLPRVQFHAHALEEVLRELAVLAREHDPAKRGVSLLITPHFPDRPDGWRGPAIGPDGKLLPPPIPPAQLGGRNLGLPGGAVLWSPTDPPAMDQLCINIPQPLIRQPLSRVLDAICQASPYPITYRVEAYGVLITPDYAPRPGPVPARKVEAALPAPVAADVRRLTSPQTPPASQSLLTSAATNATPASDPLQAAQEEALRRQERMLVLDRLLGEARQFQKIKSWTNAVVRYEEGLLLVPPLNGPFGAPRQVTDAIAGLNYCRLQLAIEHKQRSEFAQATELADKVLALDPANDFARLVKQLVERVSKPTPSAAAVSVDAADQAKAERLIASARLRLGQNNTRDALQNLWAALLTNPRSDADSSLLLLLLDKRFEDERVRLAATQWGRVVAVTQKWNEEARSKNGLPVPNPYAKTNSQVPFLTHSSKGAQRINRKLEEIVLPEVHFDAVPLVEVVKWLDVAARNHDPEKKGLNFLFNDVAPQAPLLDAGGNPVPGVQRVSLGEGLIRVSQPLKNLTLRQALDVICKNAELPTQFSVEEYAIVFIPRGPVAYYSRMFRVSPDTFIQGLQGVVGSPVLGVTSGGANQPGAAGQNQPATTTTTTGPVRAVVPATVPATQRTAAEANALVRQFFQSAGVTALGATNGSTRVFFNPENGLLVARGTTNDLRVIEQAIQKVQPSATPPPTGPESRAPERDRPGRSSPASTNAPTSSTPSAPAKPVVKIETRIFERAEPFKNLSGVSLANTLRFDPPVLFTNLMVRAADIRKGFWPPITTNQVPADARIENELYEAKLQLAVVVSRERRETLLKSLAAGREWKVPDIRLRDGQQGQAQSVEGSTVIVGTPSPANPGANVVSVTTGVTVDLWPKLSADSTSLQLGYVTDVREFLGYAHTTKSPPEAVPRFRVRQAIGTNTLALGESLLLTVVATVPPPGNGPGAAPGGAERTLFVLLTATLDDNAQAAPERDRPGRSGPASTNAPTSLPPGVKAYYRTNGEAPFLTHSSKGAQRINRKLDEIILPETHFDSVTLPEVVKSLDASAKRFDPEKKGLNVLINNVVSDYIALNDAKSGKPAAPLLDPMGNPIVSPAAKPPRPDLETALIKVTRPIKDLTLRQVLDVICKTATVKLPNGRTAGLKYSVEEYAVVFSPKLPESPSLFPRMFKVDPATFIAGLGSVVEERQLRPGSRAALDQALREKAWTNAPAGTNRFSVGGVVVTKGSTGVVNTNVTAELNHLVRLYFTAAGVTDLGATNGPDATQVFFNDRNGLLLVRASLQDLDIIQMAIELLNVKPPQVLIEAKFVEISQNDDKAVGFDWFKGNAAVKPPEAQPDGVRRLWIDREGNYKLDGRARSLDQIEDELKAVSRTNAGVVVRIGAEHEARYSDATPVFERLSRIGITNSSFAVAPEMKGLPVRQPTAVNPTGIFPQLSAVRQIQPGRVE